MSTLVEAEGILQQQQTALDFHVVLKIDFHLLLNTTQVWYLEKKGEKRKIFWISNNKWFKKLSLFLSMFFYEK